METIISTNSKSIDKKSASKVSQSRSKVYAQTLSVDQVSQIEIERMYNIFSKYYTNHNKVQFVSDLLEKNHVILLRDTKNKSIQGFSTILKIDLQNYGFNGMGIFSGDTVLEKEYWGNKALGVAFLKYLWLEKIKSPFQPLYWFLISKGYKTYLLMANNFEIHFPRHEKKTPEKIQSLMDMFYRSKYPQCYSLQDGIINFNSAACCLKENVAQVTAELMRNPRVNFFVKRNPGWDKGNELACIAEMSLLLPISYFIKKTILRTFKK